ncbi:hypothetical protein KORDIASMS9_03194 [Kordia sp. SMS9]|uniref:hypothetical protein n=1 Tax=Kordia sp. SMS9 TaxID=2282170 RepID=UPI000E0DE0A4|nr:hypothetical protein [Kordia sp. SMS9]AXG70939.1 hypothetical protein KORDIASMS9_03194 [Kordia sp. SMS9]
MKKLVLVIIVLSYIYVLSSCDEKHVAPSNVGTHVLGILQTLDTLSESNFEKHFISYNELHNTMSDIGAAARKAFYDAPLDKDSYAEAINDLYHQFKVGEMKNYITWKDMEYVDFEYRKYSDYGVTLIAGVLRFKNSKANYSIKIHWLSTPKTAGLLELFSFWEMNL